MKEEENQLTRVIMHTPKEEDTIEEIKEPENPEVIEEQDEKHSLKKILTISISLLILIILYAYFIGTSFLDVNEYKIESSIIPNSFNGIKAVHISDIHYGIINKDKLENMINKVNELKPDIIFFTGDLIDKNITATDELKNGLISSLSKLNSSYKYAIYGNEDYNNDFYKEIITSSDFVLLENEAKLLYYKDSIPIEIIGFNSLETNPNYTDMNNLLEDTDNSTLYKIVLIHEPDSLDNFINYEPNLILSGHTLGGLVKLPLGKPLFLPENGKTYYEEYYEINNSKVFISNGIGTSNLSIRLNNHPSINFYRFYKIKEE